MPEKSDDKNFKGKSFCDILSMLVPSFVKVYSASQGNSFIDNNMPRRMQLSSLVFQLLFQDSGMAENLFNEFFADKEIKQFFGHKADEPIRLERAAAVSEMCVIDNSGNGGSQQPVSIISSILLTAIDLSVLERGEMIESDIISNIPKAFERFKMYIRKEPVPEEHLIGVSGFQVENGVKIGLGELSAKSLNDFQSSYFFGHDKNVFLALQIPFERKMIFAGTFEQLQQYLKSVSSQSIFTDRENLNRIIRDIRLSLVLSLSNDEKAFPAFIEDDYLITSSGGAMSFMWSNNNQPRKISDMKLAKKDVSKISIKYLTISNKDISSINVAIKRLLSAVCSRDDPDDALIDAVMCWENVIGSDKEVTFKVCSSIAKVLSKRQDDRIDILRELKDIYELRSKLVHGSSKYKTDLKQINSAIIYAIKLMNVILDDDEMMKSPDRSRYILLEN